MIFFTSYIVGNENGCSSQKKKKKKKILKMDFQAFIFSFVGVAASTYAKHACHPLDDHTKVSMYISLHS